MTCINQYDIESEPENAFKAVAQEIIKLDPSPYKNGLYLRAVNEQGCVESYLLVNTEEDGKKSFFVRGCNSYWNGWGNDYKDTSEKTRYLVCLDEETNDYKSYTMFQEQGNGKFGVSYGRIGGTDLLDRSKYNFDKEGSHYYPADMFWIKYYEKIMKGYIDKTEEMDFQYKGKGVSRTEPKKEIQEYLPIEEEETKDLIEFLISRQRGYVQDNYNYTDALGKQLNEKAIKHSEDLLDRMSSKIQQLQKEPLKENKDNCLQEFKELYKELVLTLPRKIGNVRDYINRVVYDKESSENEIGKVLQQERELLDALKDVIAYDKEQTLPCPAEKKETVLEHFGLSARVSDFKDKFLTLDKMGEDAYRVSKVLEVHNYRTEKAFEECKKALGIEERGVHLLWHGSRTENWWSIFRNGMSLNPDAVVTGKMFGQGLYFAPKAAKSMGYADIHGSYWARGTQDTGYMALFEVAMGKPYETYSATDPDFCFKDLKHGCHSVWAKAGLYLYNDECIVYREDQCNIRYLVEVDNNRNIDYQIPLKKARDLHIKNTEVKDSVLSFSVPNFSTCTGFKIKGVTAEYDLASDALTWSDDAEYILNSADKEYLKDVVMSKFADSKREFEIVAQQILEKGEIPKDILARITKENKTRPKDYMVR